MENLKDNRGKGASEMSQGEAEHSGKVACTATNFNGDEHSFSCEQTCTKKTKTAPQMKFDAQSGERKIGERGNTKQHLNVAINPEESRDQMSSSQGDYRRNTIADEPAAVQEVGNIQKPSQRTHVSHSTKSKEKNLNETSASVEKDVERIRRERELEKDGRGDGERKGKTERHNGC